MGVRPILAVLSVFICACQPGIAHSLAIGEIYPDVVLVFIIVSGLVGGPDGGAFTGLVCGILQSSQAGTDAVGAMLLSRLFVGFVAGLLGERVFSQNLIAPAACALVATLVGEGVYFLIAPYPLLGVWARCTTLEALYNAALALPIYWGVHYIVRRLTPGPAPAFIER